MRTVTAAFLMAATLAVGRAAVAQNAPAPGVQQRESLPRLDPKRDDKAFAAVLAETQRLHSSNGGDDCTRAYPQYLAFAKERPDNPDVLWGIGECGTATTSALTDPTQQRARLADAKAAYERYAEAERRPEFAEGAKSRIARAKARAAQLEDVIAAIVVPVATPAATVAAAAVPNPTPDPTPGIPGVEGTGPAAVAPPAAAPGDRLAKADGLAREGKFREAIVEVEALLAFTPDDLLAQEQFVMWSAMLGECRQALERYERIHLACARVNVHEAAANCAEEMRAASILLHALEGTVRVASYVEPTVYADLGEIYAAMGEQEKAKAAFERYLAVEHRAKHADRREEVAEFLAGLSSTPPPAKRHRVVSHEAHLKCLTQRGLVTAQFANVDGRIVMQLRPPENWHDIPCTRE